MQDEDYRSKDQELYQKIDSYFMALGILLHALEVSIRSIHSIRSTNDDYDSGRWLIRQENLSSYDLATWIVGSGLSKMVGRYKPALIQF